MQNGPYIAPDLSQFNSESVQKSYNQIWALFQTSIEYNPGTKNVKIVEMKKDAYWEHYYHVIF